MENKRYRLAPGTQVRDEDFGLLFYTKSGPQLFFVNSKDMLESPFFDGRHTFAEWMHSSGRRVPVERGRMEQLERVLRRLCEKGVVLEC